MLLGDHLRQFLQLGSLITSGSFLSLTFCSRGVLRLAQQQQQQQQLLLLLGSTPRPAVFAAAAASAAAARLCSSSCCRFAAAAVAAAAAAAAAGAAGVAGARVRSSCVARFASSSLRRFSSSMARCSCWARDLERSGSVRNRVTVVETFAAVSGRMMTTPIAVAGLDLQTRIVYPDSEMSELVLPQRQLIGRSSCQLHGEA